MSKQTRIDEIDAKILKALLRESRTSFTEIAKNSGISVAAVTMRFARLKRTGIINGEIMQVNPYVLGYECVSDMGITTAIDNENKVMEFLRSKPYITDVTGPFGKYNLWAMTVLNHIHELPTVIADIESNPLVKRVDSLIWPEAIYMDHAENLTISPVAEKSEGTAIHEPAANRLEETRMDETDRRIAKILSQNARKPFRKIAEQLGVSTQSVIQRYKRLRGNVLTLSTITVDLQKLGYGAMAHLLIKVANRSKMTEIYAQMLQISNLIVAVKLIGPYDLLALVALKDFEEALNLTEAVRGIQGIDQTDTFLRRNFPQWPLNLFAHLL